MSKLSTTIVITLTIGFVAAAGLNVIQYQRAQNTQKLLKGEITDLRYELNQQADGADTDAPTGSLNPPTPTAGTPTPAPSVAGAATLSIPEIGAKVSYADPVSDLTYYMTKSAGIDVAALITTKIKTDFPACNGSSVNNVLGQLVRKEIDKSSGIKLKKIGNYYYFYIRPTSYCTDSGTGRATLDAARTYVENFVAPSITQ